MTIKYYEGNRIYFRPLELSDEPLLRQWFNDHANWRTLHQCLPINEIRERKFIEAIDDDPNNITLGIALQQNNLLIGACGLQGITGPNRNATFGITIGDRAAQSNGFGREATRLILKLGFNEYNLNRIQLDVFADNHRAIKTYEHTGFKLEGRFRQAYFRNGRYIDALRYSILRAEWQTHREQTDQSSESTPDDNAPVDNTPVDNTPLDNTPDDDSQNRDATFAALML